MAFSSKKHIDRYGASVVDITLNTGESWSMYENDYDALIQSLQATKSSLVTAELNFCIGMISVNYHNGIEYDFGIIPDLSAHIDTVKPIIKLV